MTLLARVGEHLYWAARYLERAEGLARVMREHTYLLADMPTSVPLTWEPLLAMGGGGFLPEGTAPSEAAIVRHLIGGTENPESIAEGVTRARENLRACREVIPVEAWLVANDLFLYLEARRGEGVDRGSRARLLDRVIEDHQLFLGILLGNMIRDQAFTLMRLGRHIERVALITRVLDVRAGQLLGPADAGRYEEIQWIGVLRSLSALHMFHRASGEPVDAVPAMRFLILNAGFPRSVSYCLTAIAQTVAELPMPERLLGACEEALVVLEGLERSHDAAELHAGAGELSRCIADIHDEIVAVCFPDSLPAA